jgi:thioredoxin-related protein
MRTLLSVIVASLAVLLACNGAGRAAVDRVAAHAVPMELLVFEHADCVYCRVFRRDVAPKYEHSAAAAGAPMRFVDIAKADLDGYALKARIGVLPTAVLMKGGQEVDRIVGYWGSDNFFKLLSHLLARAE